MTTISKSSLSRARRDASQKAGGVDLVADDERRHEEEAVVARVEAHAEVGLVLTRSRTAACRPQRASPRCDPFPPDPCGRARHGYLGAACQRWRRRQARALGMC